MLHIGLNSFFRIVINNDRPVAFDDDPGLYQQKGADQQDNDPGEDDQADEVDVQQWKIPLCGFAGLVPPQRDCARPET